MNFMKIELGQDFEKVGNVGVFAFNTSDTLNEGIAQAERRGLVLKPTSRPAAQVRVFYQDDVSFDEYLDSVENWMKNCISTGGENG